MSDPDGVDLPAVGQGVPGRSLVGDETRAVKCPSAGRVGRFRAGPDGGHTEVGVGEIGAGPEEFSAKALAAAVWCQPAAEVALGGVEAEGSGISPVVSSYADQKHRLAGARSERPGQLPEGASAGTVGRVDAQQGLS